MASWLGRLKHKKQQQVAEPMSQGGHEAVMEAAAETRDAELPTTEAVRSRPRWEPRDARVPNKRESIIEDILNLDLGQPAVYRQPAQALSTTFETGSVQTLDQVSHVSTALHEENAQTGRRIADIGKTSSGQSGGEISTALDRERLSTSGQKEGTSPFDMASSQPTSVLSSNITNAAFTSPTDLTLSTTWSQSERSLSGYGQHSIPRGYHITSLGRVVKDEMPPAGKAPRPSLQSPSISESFRNPQSPVPTVVSSPLTPSPSKISLPPPPPSTRLRSTTSAWSLANIRTDGRRLRTTPPTPSMPFYHTRMVDTGLPRHPREAGWDEAVKYCKRELKLRKQEEKAAAKAEKKSLKQAEKDAKANKKLERHQTVKALERLERRGSVSGWLMRKPHHEISEDELQRVSRDLMGDDERLLRLRDHLFTYDPEEQQELGEDTSAPSTQRSNDDGTDQVPSPSTPIGLGIDIAESNSIAPSSSPSYATDSNAINEVDTTGEGTNVEKPSDDVASIQSEISTAGIFERSVERMGKHFSLQLDTLAPMLKAETIEDAVSEHAESKFDEDASVYSQDIDEMPLSPAPLSIRKQPSSPSTILHSTPSSPQPSVSKAVVGQRPVVPMRQIGRLASKEELRQRLRALTESEGFSRSRPLSALHPMRQMLAAPGEPELKEGGGRPVTIVDSRSRRSFTAPVTQDEFAHSTASLGRLLEETTAQVEQWSSSEPGLP